MALIKCYLCFLVVVELVAFDAVAPFSFILKETLFWTLQHSY